MNPERGLGKETIGLGEEYGLPVVKWSESGSESGHKHPLLLYFDKILNQPSYRLMSDDQFRQAQEMGLFEEPAEL